MRLLWLTGAACLSLLLWLSLIKFALWFADYHNTDWLTIAFLTSIVCSCICGISWMAQQANRASQK